jgi:3-oxoacyl-[acyl-carrier protein] reductase
MAMTPVEEVTEEVWCRIMDINAKGIFLGCKYAIPIMKKQGGGVIINTASVSGVRARPGLSAYTASKGAAILLTRGLAIELAPHQIRVNCLNPVAADTPMLPKFIDDSGATDKKYEDAKQRFIDTVPMGRLATAQDVARAALFLASDDASFITGVGLEVDGGRAI